MSEQGQPTAAHIERPRKRWPMRIAIALALLITVALFWPPRWYPVFEPSVGSIGWLPMYLYPPTVGYFIDTEGQSISPAYYQFEPGFAEALQREIAQRPVVNPFWTPDLLLDDQGRIPASILVGIWAGGRDHHAGESSFDPFDEGPLPWPLGSEVLFVNRDGSVAFSVAVEGGEAIMQPIPGFREGLAVVPTAVRESTTSFMTMADDGTLFNPHKELTRFGFVRPDGSWAVEPQFEDALSFREGLAAAKQDGLWGYVDRSGTFIIEPKWRRATSFSEGLAAAWDEDSGWGYIGTDGSWVIEPRFHSAGAFSEGLAPARDQSPTWDSQSSRTMFGYIDTQGEWVIEPRFHQAEAFSHGRACVAVDAFTFGGMGVFAYIDPRGEIVIPGPFEYADSFRHGETMVTKRVSLARWLLSPYRMVPVGIGETHSYYGIDEDFSPV